jgi:flagellar hook assembly protein FlgD
MAVPRAGDVSVSVIDLRGALVQQVAKGAFEPGRHTLRWNGTDESGRPARPGVYFVRATYGGQTSNLRFAVIR